MKIKKRDERLVELDPSKITLAAKKALEEVGSSYNPELITTKVLEQVADGSSVEYIQDLVEDALLKADEVQAAHAFIRYREQRTNARELKSDLFKQFDLIAGAASADVEFKRENANINADSPMGAMLKYGSESSKEYTLKRIVKPEHAKLHRQGDIHIHDLDFLSVCFNCILDSTIIIIRKNGSEQRISIRDAFPLLGNGTHHIDGVEILSRNGFTPLHFLHIRDADEMMYGFITSNRTLDCTGDHVLPVIRDGKEIELPAKEIKQTDKLVVNHSRYSWEDVNRVDDGTIKSIRKYHFKGKVVDLTTGDHYFIANNIVSHNCCQIPLGKLLKEGFNTGHGHIRQPNSILSAATVACIVLQANQNDMFGGQSFPMWDYDLAPYVARSFIKHAQNVSDILGIGLAEDFREKCLDYYNKNSTLISAKEFLAELGVTERAYSEAYRLTDRETHQAMQAVIHNLNTMNCMTKSAQVLMADGTTKSIVKITVGDSVVSLNQQTGALENKRVIETFDNGIQMVRDYTFEDGTVITATPRHKALCHGVYTPIEACESVDGVDGAPVKIVSKSELREEHVYDIEVDGNHNFVGDGKFFHNCRAGAQVPFSSINYGTDTSAEGRMIIKATLDETDNGLGGGETPIFPVQVFKFKRSVNGERGTPNYDLFQLSCKVSAKRLFPNYGVLDSWYNRQYYKEGHPETEMAVMGCRTRVVSNDYCPEKTVIPGRGNFAFTTINLPALGIRAEHSVPRFFELFDEMIDACIDQLKDRFEYISHKHAYNFPFLMGQGVYLDSDRLAPDDEIGEVIKHASLSVGFIGLAECLVALIGKHHGESKTAQKLGLDIVHHLRMRMDQEIKKTGLNWSCFATPAEGLCSRAAKLNRKRFGLIPGVTDRDYLTNSSHVPVYYPISAQEKMRIEAPYHALCNAGHIGYVEVDGDLTKNPQALEALVKYAADLEMNYFSVNHPVDMCPVCGYVGVIGDQCPRCGFTEKDGVTVEHLMSCGCGEALKRIEK